MSISGMLNAGLTGLTATARSLNVTSDNIANVNTIGHQGSRAVFEDVLSLTVVGVGQIGGGARVASIESLFNQGSIVGSARSTDMAIAGRGFFMLRGRHNGVDGNYFTRAGQFLTDDQGYLVNPGGLRLQGYLADPTGNIQPTLADLRIVAGAIQPTASTQINVALSLNADAATASLTGAIDPTDSTTYHFRTGVQVFDSIGAAHQVSLYIVRRAADSWEWLAQVDGGEVAGGTAGTPVNIGTGTLTMANNVLATQTNTATPVDFLNAATGQSIAFDFTGTDAVSHPIQQQGNSIIDQGIRVISQETDGSASAEFLEVSISADGVINANYDDDTTRILGRVAVASFRSETNLARVSGTFFRATPGSGTEVVGFAGTGGRGSIKGSSLEQSNVDLSAEFVRLITDQRAYQAATRTITTADELLVETMNIKR